MSHSVLELDFSLFSLLALWGNKNWPPSIKVRQIENLQNKIGLKGCKSSSLNAPGTQTPLPHPNLKFERFPFSRHDRKCFLAFSYRPFAPQFPVRNRSGSISPPKSFLTTLPFNEDLSVFFIP